MSTPIASDVDVDLQPGTPPTLHPQCNGDPLMWIAEHRDALRSATADHGALLIRGLELRSPHDVTAAFGKITSHLMTEMEGFAARRSYGNGVYSSSAWPPSQPMCMHHELSYALDVPGLMLFACIGAPTTGGATGVADATAVLDALPTELVQRFERTGWLLSRNYHDDIGASIADSFGTDDRGVIETYCRTRDIAFEWQPDGGLRTWQHRPAVVRHPVTGQPCWFNQIAFLNEWTIAPEVREYLLDVYGAEGLPFNTHFGDGEPIGPEVVQLLNEVYETHTVRTTWHTGDLLLVDNIRTAHSREPFTGPRDVLVGLADPIRLGGVISS